MARSKERECLSYSFCLFVCFQGSCSGSYSCACLNYYLCAVESLVVNSMLCKQTTLQRFHVDHQHVGQGCKYLRLFCRTSSFSHFLVCVQLCNEISLPMLFFWMGNDRKPMLYFVWYKIICSLSQGFLWALQNIKNVLSVALRNISQVVLWITLE